MFLIVSVYAYPESAMKMKIHPISCIHWLLMCQSPLSKVNCVYIRTDIHISLNVVIPVFRTELIAPFFKKINYIYYTLSVYSAPSVTYGFIVVFFVCRSTDC